MIIIGINGHNGAGKTTVSHMLFQKENTKIISLDSLFDGLKKGMFCKYSTLLEKTNGEKAVYLSTDSKLQKLLQMKFILVHYCRVKLFLAHLFINQKIKEYSRQNISYVIIEGGVLDVYKLDYLCDINIFVKSSIKNRYARVIERDKAGLSSLNILEAFKEDSKRKVNLINYYIINNDDNINTLLTNVKKLEKVINRNLSDCKRKTLWKQH